MRQAAALLLSLAAAATARAQEEPLPDGVLEVVVVGLEHDGGQVGCSLFASSRGFPRDRARAVRGDLVRPRDRRAVCTFRDVAPGVYAVAVLHDEDADGKLDTGGLFGAPTEGYGASNDAHSTFGPPEWQDARFRYGGRGATIRVRMRY